MNKKIISLIILIILIILISMPSILQADGIKSIIIVVDEMSLDLVQDLFQDNSSIGFMNLKTREKYSEENLYLSINKGRKLSGKNLKEEKDIELLGDALKREKPSHIGIGKEGIILWNSQGKVDYEKKSILYNIDWLLENTDNILEKSNILVLGYDFNDEADRIYILKKYLGHYKDKQIIILPKYISKEDENLLNKSLIPIVHRSNNVSGLLTSSSTNREGFITIEDISVQLKNTHGYFNKADIGNSFKIIEKENPTKELNNIYKTTMNLLILAYIFHGMLYISQFFSGLSFFKYKEMSGRVYFLYVFSTVIISISLILGIFNLHRNIFIYLSITIISGYIISRKIIKKKETLVQGLAITTYALISFGTLFHPKMIYNSYIGFNNLVYGARYYGLNNGIMGVLLVSSILSFFTLNRTIESVSLKRILVIFIFGLNMVVLSTNFGANTGGYITSIILFVLMIYMVFFTEDYSYKKVILFLLIGISLFIFNMIVDNSSGNKSHAIKFLYRIKENGFSEFIYMAGFKAKELILLTLKPPFSLVLIFQGIILSRIRKDYRKYGEIKKEANIIIFTSLIGFLINDTGIIMLIYMLNYFILYAVSNGRFIE